MSDNTVLPTGSGGDTIRTIDRITSKTQVVGLDVGGEPGAEALVTSNNPLPVTHPTPAAVVLDAAQYDDDGVLYVNPNVPGADIATGDRQQQQLLALLAGNAGTAVIQPGQFFSSTGQLAQGQTFTTGWIDTGPANGNAFSVTMAVQADQPIGFVYQESIDNGLTVRTADQDTIAANINFSEVHVAFARWVQFTFTNVGTTSTTNCFISVCQRSAGNPEAQRLVDRFGNDILATGSALNVAPNLPPNAAQEFNGQLQRIADAMEALLLENRVHSVLLASLGQSVPEDPDRLRNDINLSLQ